MSHTTIYKLNDRLPEYTATLMQGNSTPIDLTTADAVEFHMRPKGGGPIKIEAAATIVSAAAGTVKYPWADGDLDTVGIYDVEWEIMYPGDRTLTVPAADCDVIKIVDDLDE